MKKQNIHVQGVGIQVMSKGEHDYISLTDMIKAKDGEFFVSDWLRNRNTVEFLGIWEEINNSNFNYGEFAIVKSNAGLNSYKISIKEWVEKTKAIGLISKEGRYGGTFVHKDIAFEFGMWISPRFKLYLIKEFQRLKLEENDKKLLDWDVKRMLTKINYHIHTDSVQRHIIVPNRITKKDSCNIFATEADVLNMALFGITAAEWRKQNKNKEGNMRDHADVSQLICLSNLENINALLIKQNISQHDRLIELNSIAINQMELLVKKTQIKKLSKK